MLGIFSWGLYCTSSGTLRAIVGKSIIAAAAGLMLFQALEVQKICMLCLAHSLAAIAGVVLTSKRTQLEPCFVLGVVLSVATLKIASPSDPNVIDGREQHQEIFTNTLGYSWLGPTNYKSPLLVVSFTCGHCVDLLRRIQLSKCNQGGTCPRIFILAGDANFEANALMLAVILFRTAHHDKQAGFAMAMDDFSKIRAELMKGDLDKSKERLEMIIPEFVKYLPQAKRQLFSQQNLLSHLELRGTPFLLTADGVGTYKVHESMFTSTK
ncbi:MAG TPA: hypothetical protein PKX00_10565 [Opitutaceae bacterium]|nr:hypothetical protein [Opitutaceae bacterium]